MDALFQLFFKHTVDILPSFFPKQSICIGKRFVNFRRIKSFYGSGFRYFKIRNHCFKDKLGCVINGKTKFFVVNKFQSIKRCEGAKANLVRRLSVCEFFNQLFYGNFSLFIQPNLNNHPIVCDGSFHDVKGMCWMGDMPVSVEHYELYPFFGDVFKFFDAHSNRNRVCFYVFELCNNRFNGITSFGYIRCSQISVFTDVGNIEASAKIFEKLTFGKVDFFNSYITAMKHLHLKPSSVVSANFQKCHVGMIFGLSMFVFVVVKEELQSAIFVQVLDNFFYGSFEAVCEGSDYKVGVANFVLTLFNEGFRHNLNSGLVSYDSNIENFYREAA